MPLTKKGTKILSRLKDFYGATKGLEIFYKMQQERKLTGVEKKKRKKR